MKIYFTFILLFSSSIFILAQDYQFEVSNGSYEDLLNPISLTNGDCWDDPTFEITQELPITEWFGTPIEKYTIKDSYLYLGNASDDNIISPFSIDLYCNGISIDNSYIAYEHGQGMNGGKILKIEWRESGFANLEGFFDIINFQCWIFESGVIEFHYGQGGTSLAEISYTEIGEVFGGFTGLTNMSSNAMYIEGSTDNYQWLNGMIDFENPPLLTNFPAEGTIYRFSPEVSSVSAEKKNNIDLISTLVEMDLRFNNNSLIPIQGITIINYQGAKVMQIQAGLHQTVFSMEDLTTGYYVAQVLADGKLLNFSFFKL